MALSTITELPNTATKRKRVCSLHLSSTDALTTPSTSGAGLPANLSPNLPVLFMWGTADSTVAPAAVRNSSKFISQLQDVAFEGRGHWLMVEAKDEITNRVLSWLQDLTRQPICSGKL